MFLTDPADTLTSNPNNSHKLRPSFEEQLNRGRKSFEYETMGWKGAVAVDLDGAGGGGGGGGGGVISVGTVAAAVATCVSIFSTIVPDDSPTLATPGSLGITGVVVVAVVVVTGVVTIAPDGVTVVVEPLVAPPLSIERIFSKSGRLNSKLVMAPGVGVILDEELVGNGIEPVSC